MDFETYLTSKKIDAAGFANAEPAVYERLKSLFLQMHPESFTTQKKFIINRIRRAYLLKS
ncbi:MAG: hypothetical protein EAZ55_00170 [Cytophagales bacterium]|nr:MAG: hypothetical protein EAZ55_00170 [Cytophagales bacterium]